jgi:MFS family permease
VAGALISAVGSWMQLTTQDWLVLTQLTQHRASAVGIVTALQFAPMVLLLPWTGLAADRLDRRRLLFAAETAMGVLALALGGLTLIGAVRLWHVYLFAFLLGCAAAFDLPARQAFVAELVEESDLSNAVALNALSLNTARMIGPAVAGLLAATVGPGWVFVVNAGSFGAVLASLGLLRVSKARPTGPAVDARGGLAQGLRYVRSRADLKVGLLMVSLMSMFAFNFPIFISTMSVNVFHTDAGKYGLATSMLAVGTVAGALLVASQERPHERRLLASAAVFGLTLALAAIAPSYWLFGLALVATGLFAQTFWTSAISLVQLSTERAMRGRVLAILSAVVLACTPIGSFIVGWVADRCGPRWALAVGAAAALLAAAVAAWRLSGHGRAVAEGRRIKSM